jgi:hypothetical protein
MPLSIDQPLLPNGVVLKLEDGRLRLCQTEAEAIAVQAKVYLGRGVLSK